MQVYLDMQKHVLENGVHKSDRTGVGTTSVFGYEVRLDLQQGFPALTTKKLFFKGVVGELIWFLQGKTNISYLQENGIKIWNEWADDQLELGPVYGAQWRAWPGDNGPIDQITNVIEQIKNNPDSRRLIVSAWNVSELDKMALPPCHLLFQFYVANNKLSIKVIQRSADVFLGVPFNFASYALLVHMMAAQCNLEVGELIWSGGDVHIYDNHIEAVKLQQTRTPHQLPRLNIKNARASIFDYEISDFELLDYVSHGMIKAEIAV